MFKLNNEDWQYPLYTQFRLSNSYNFPPEVQISFERRNDSVSVTIWILNFGLTLKQAKSFIWISQVISPIFYNVPFHCCWDCAENFKLFRHLWIFLPKFGCCRVCFSFDVLEAFGDFSCSFLMCSLWMSKTFKNHKGEGKNFCNTIWPFPHTYLNYIFFRIYLNKRKFSFRSQNLLGHVLPACSSNWQKMHCL